MATALPTDVQLDENSSPKPPVRVLVQTLTHLVPGEGSHIKTWYILNMVCQKYWNCDFQAPKFRWASFDAEFAFPNRRCFFLLDYGESENDDLVPIIALEWTGEILKPVPQILNHPKIIKALRKDTPFTWKPSKQRETLSMREHIKDSLYCGDSSLENGFVCSEIDYIRDRPEDLAWLKENLQPKFWSELVIAINGTRPAGAALIEK